MSANDDKSAPKSESSNDGADGTGLGLDELVSFDGDSFLAMEDGDDFDFGAGDDGAGDPEGLDFGLDSNAPTTPPPVLPPSAIPVEEADDDILDLEDLIEDTSAAEMPALDTPATRVQQPSSAPAVPNDARATDSQLTSNHDILEEDILDEEESRDALLASLLQPTNRSAGGTKPTAEADAEENDNSRSTREVDTLDASILDDLDDLDDMEASHQYNNPTVDLGGLDFEALRTGNVKAVPDEARAAAREDSYESMDPGLAAAAMAEARRPSGPAPHERGFTSEMSQQGAADAHIQAVSEADRQFRTIFMLLIAALILAAVALIVTLILFMQNQNGSDVQVEQPPAQTSGEAPPGPETAATGAQVRGSPNTQSSALPAPNNTAERADQEPEQSAEREVTTEQAALNQDAATPQPAAARSQPASQTQNEQRAAAARTIEAQQQEQQRRERLAAENARAAGQATSPNEPTEARSPEAATELAVTPASLNFAGSPSSRVYIDGMDTGRNTPLMGIERPPGTYTIRFVNEAHGIDQTSRITVSAGERAVVRVNR